MIQASGSGDAQEVKGTYSDIQKPVQYVESEFDRLEWVLSKTGETEPIDELRISVFICEFDFENAVDDFAFGMSLN